MLQYIVTPAESYQPGVCNIGPAEIRRRRQVGYAGVAAALGLGATLLAIDAPAFMWLSLAVPVAIDANEEKKARADLRILCLGDSFTYSLCASDRDHAWPAVLEKRLSESLPGQSIRVVNAGTPGKNSSTSKRSGSRPAVVISTLSSKRRTARTFAERRIRARNGLIRAST